MGQDNESEMPERALTASCWQPTGSECDPRDAAGCDVTAGETCDIAQTPGGEPNLVCLSGPNTQQLGDDCNPSSGPFLWSGFAARRPVFVSVFVATTAIAAVVFAARPSLLRLEHWGCAKMAWLRPHAAHLVYCAEADPNAARTTVMRAHCH